MVFSFVVIILVVGIAYFHWVQGMLSGIISMVFAVIASAAALGFHEWVVASLLGGRMGDYASGMMICVIFAAVYGLGRIAFDSLIPGNVRLPLYLDKVGGAACGFIAGIFCVGTVAVAVQSMPFGPTIAGFSRYPLADTRSVSVPGPRRQLDADVTDALEEDFPAPDKEASLMLAADEMVVDYATFQSASGSLAGNERFGQQHPDLLRSLFFQRVGIEPGAKHVALNIGGKSEVAVSGLFAPATLPQIEGELSSIRAVQGARKLPPTLPGDAKSGKVNLIVRTTVKLNATDADKRLRFSPGQARLVIDGKNYYPVGTLHHPGNLVLATRMDDFLIAEMPEGTDTATIDLVYHLDRSEVLAGGAGADEAGKPAALKLKDDAFFEFKRLARIDLSAMDVATTPPPSLAGPQTPQTVSSPVSPGGLLRKEPVRTAIQER